MLKFHIAAVVVLLVTVLNVIDAQKKDKYGSKIKLESESDLDRLSENLNMTLPQKQKLSSINKLIKASKLDLSKFNDKEFNHNRTNVEFHKKGNRTVVFDKDMNSTIDEVNSDDLGAHQNWYWWG
ncbi:hypothetical protein M8J76_003714 [Diaphorina citri]|nr:hypothetical protein M8J75_011602 [Diaphorina citri]KAI5732751.1 hypothetical protein M8J76_003714 [Diaphorina citri]KAI5739668.1 hypothetical protein M8J77_021933 [Diaphorina citri]